MSESKKEEGYTKEFYCSNCERSFHQRFEFGEVAHQPSCPFCGVATEQLRGWQRR